MSGRRRALAGRRLSTGPVVKAASGGLNRRLAQAVMTFAVVATATAAALLGITLLTSSNIAAQSANTGASRRRRLGHGERVPRHRGRTSCHPIRAQGSPKSPGPTWKPR